VTSILILVAMVGAVVLVEGTTAIGAIGEV
jgi:hypothetical protein